MSGVTRLSNTSAATISRVGIHRPYLSDAEVGYDFERGYRQLRDELEAYFDEMRVSKVLLDLMYSVPPEGMRFLTGRELQDVLPVDDPVYDEQRTTEMAKHYGITNAEYRSRKAQTEACLLQFNRGQITFEKMEPCEQAILWGVTLSEYLLRNRLSREICVAQKGQLSGSEIPPGITTPECVNRIMRDGF
jgi:hypothetical protein